MKTEAKKILIIEDEKRNKDIAELEPTYYFTKVNVGIGQLVQKIKERLEI